MHPRAAIAQLSASVATYDGESRVLGLARTIIAIAQLSVLALTPSTYLFVPIGGPEIRLPCTSAPQTASLYCLTPGLDRQVVSWIIVGLLVVVASGFAPRYSSIVHFWASLSVHSAISLPDGGETVAQVCTAFIALAAANDRRTWHWQRSPGARTRSAFQGVAWAGHWGLRAQVAYIYLNSALAKLSVASWQDGTATYYVTRMESFGAAGALNELAMWATAVPAVALLTTWGTIAGEFIIAVLLVRRGRWLLTALGLSVSLHLMIIVQLGIVSFGLIMIGVVLAAAHPAVTRSGSPAGRSAEPVGPHRRDLPRMTGQEGAIIRSST